MISSAFLFFSIAPRIALSPHLRASQPRIGISYNVNYLSSFEGAGERTRNGVSWRSILFEGVVRLGPERPDSLSFFRRRKPFACLRFPLNSRSPSRCDMARPSASCWARKLGTSGSFPARAGPVAHASALAERFFFRAAYLNCPSLLRTPLPLSPNKKKQARNTAARAGVEFYGPDRAL